MRPAVSVTSTRDTPVSRMELRARETFSSSSCFKPLSDASISFTVLFMEVSLDWNTMVWDCSSG